MFGTPNVKDVVDSAECFQKSWWSITRIRPVVGEGRKRARTQNWGKRVGHQLSSWEINCWILIDLLIPGVSKMFPPLPIKNESQMLFRLKYLPFALADPGFGHAFPCELGPETQTSKRESRVFMHCRCRELAKDRLCEDSFRVHYVDLVWLRFWWRHQTHSLFVVP